MTSKHMHEGKTIDYTPGSAMTSGQSVELNADNFIGIVISDIPANTMGALAVEGVYEMDKGSSSTVFDLGERCEVVVTAGAEAVGESATGRHVVAKASANGEDTVWVKINAMPGG